MNHSLVYRALGLAGGLLIASCVQDSTGPRGARPGHLTIAPVFESRAVMLVDFDRVRIRLVRPNSNEVVLDTTVLFPAGVDTLTLSLVVPVQGSGEHFSLALAMVNAAGDTVFRGGPTDIQVQPGVLTTAPAQLPMRYTGVGSNAASVRFVAPPAVTYFGDTTLFTAEALDSAGHVIPNTPIVFSVADTTRARVPNPAEGRVVAKTVRGDVEVRASLLTPPTARTTLTIEPRPTTLAIQSGNNQTGTVGSALGQQLTALVGAADGSGVRGVRVNFAVATGGGALSASNAVTDNGGRASVTWTLGTTAGAQTATAAAPGLTPASVTFSATAAAGPARTLVYALAPPTSVAATSTFNVTVAARDTFGNAATGFTGNVALAFGANPGSATLIGTTNLNAVAGVAAFAGLRVSVATGGYTIVASSSGLPSVTSAPISVTAGTPVHLVFATPPSPVVAGAVMAPAVVATILDAAGNRVPTATDSVQVRIAAGPVGATIGGTTTVAAVAGQATFGDLTFGVAGTGYRLTLASGSMVRDTSAAFTVTPAAAATAVFTQPPTNATAGAAIAPAVQVAVRDALGNVVTSYADTVTISLASNPGGDTLAGTRQVVATAGVATFAGLTLHRASTGYQLAASAAGVAGSATSAAFAVAPAAAAHLVYAVQPSNVAVGAPIAPAVVVRAEDAFGNLVPTYPGTVGIAMGANPGGATLTGTLSGTASGGLATFADLKLDRAGTGYTLVASASSVSSATSAPFAAQSTAPTQLAFVAQPSNVTAGSAIAPAVQVALRDALNNTVSGATDSVTIAFAANPGGGTLGGTRTVAAVAGVATFANLSIDRSGAGYTLSATSGVLTAASSNAFDVAPGAAQTLVFTTQPPASTAAGQAFTTVVTVKDAAGNVVTGYGGTVTLALGANPGGDALQGTASVAASGGVATFATPYLRIVQSGYTLLATAGGVAGSAASTPITVTPGAAATLAFTSAPPASVTAGAPMSVTVTAHDAYGNVATGFTGTVTLDLGTNPAGGTLSGTLASTAVGGVATFTTPSVNLVGTGYALRAQASPMGPVTSSAFDVVPAAASTLVFTTQPAASVVAGAGLGVGVTVRDALGNAVPSHSGTVTLSLGANPTNDTLQSTVTAVLASGTASFPAAHLRRAGAGYTLVATLAGLASATSSTFDVSAAAATQVVFVQAPPVLASAGVAFQVIAGGRDAFGNGVALTDTVHLSLVANPGNDTLQGTLAVFPSGGVATFTTPFLRRVQAGYTVQVAAAGLGSTVSAPFVVQPGPAATLVFTGQPPATTPAGLAFATVVIAHDAFGNIATGFGGTVTLALGTNPGGDVLQGTTSVAASGGVATFATPFLRIVQSGYTLVASAADVAGTGTSTPIAVTPGAAASLAFTSGPPASVAAGAPMSVTVTAHDAFGNVATGFTGNVTLGFGLNPAGGTLSGTLTLSAVGGLAVFSGISIDNIGSGYTLAASSSGLTSGASTAFQITASAGVNAWLNTTGGSWSTAANWSRGVVPTATDTVEIRQSGTYTVTLDVAATVNKLTVGGSVGTQTLAVSGQTLQVDGQVDFTLHGALQMTGGTLTGTGPVNIGGSLSWQGGTITGAHQVSVLPGATLDLSGISTRTLTNQAVLELAGTGTWSGTHTVQTGNGAVLRVAAGATLEITGDPTLTANQGSTGGFGRLVNQGTINRTTSTGLVSVNAPFDNNGALSVQTGTVDVGNYGQTGTSGGSVAIASGATLQVSGGTADLTVTATVTGAGTLGATGGTVNLAGTLSIGAVGVSAGAFNYTNTGATGTAGNLTLSGGTVGGTGTVQVTGALSWTGGTFSTGAGTGRTQVTGLASIGGTVTRTLNTQYTLELAGTGTHTWAGTHTVQAGNGAVLRVASGATLNVTGDVTVIANQGSTGGFARLVNQGTITRTTSTGLVSFNVPFDNDGAVSVQTGTVDLGNYSLTGTSGGSFAVASGATLQVSGGTSALTAASSVTGAGTLGVNGGTVTLQGAFALTGAVRESSGALTFNQVSPASARIIQIAGGTFGGTGAVSATDSVQWYGGTLSGAGSLTALVGGVLEIGGAATKTILGGYRLENAGSGYWRAGNTVGSGGGAIVSNLASGTLYLRSDGGIAFNQGGSPPELRNLGSLVRDSSAGTFTIGVPVTSTKTITSVVGRLQLSGGGSLSGGVSTPGDSLILAGSATFTLTDTLSVTGTLSVEGGVLDLNGRRLSVTGRFRTAGTGQLRMVNASNLDTLITQHAVFGGGTTSGLLTNGIIRVSGDFAQVGPTTTAFAPSGGLVMLDGSGAQTLTFANPGASASRFQALQMRRQTFATDSVRLGSNVYVLDSLAVRSASVVGKVGTFRLVVGGNVRVGIQWSPALRPFVLEFAGTLGDTGTAAVQPDTLVYNTSGSYSINLQPYQHLRVNAGTPDLPIATVPGDLEVSGTARLSIPTSAHTVTGNFRTTGSGTLQMTNANGSLVVQGNASFAGGGTTGLLTAGTLEVQGNFVQVGVSGGQFAATGNHHVSFTRASGVQTIQYQDPVGSFFRDLDLNRPAVDTVRLLSNVLVSDTANLGGRTVLASTALEALKMPSTGLIEVHTGAVLKPFRAEFGTLVVDTAGLGSARIMPDTAVFLSGGSVGASGDVAYGWKSVRVAGGGVSSGMSAGTIFRGSLIVSAGSYGIGAYSTDSVAGFFRTEGTGTLVMPFGTMGQTLAVRDSAVFAGGNSTPGDGTIRLYGNFVQRTAATAYQAGQNHMVQLVGSVAQSVSFANPTQDASGSHFNALAITNASAAGVSLLSPVFANGALQDFGSAGQKYLFGNGNTLTLGGVSVSRFAINNAPLVIDTLAAFSFPTTRMDTVTFSGTASTATILQVRGNLSRSSMTFLGLNFTTPPTTGLYLDARAVGGATTVIVTLTGTSPTWSVASPKVTAGPGVILSWSP